MPSRPMSATVFAYQVGFGDCFLLRFNYAGNVQKHVLIDFGTTGLPEDQAKNHLQRVAQDIAQQCNGKLDAVVATHRHADHISGFSTTGGATSSGAIIKSLKPDVVVQPWTEKLSLAEDSLGPKGSQGFAHRRAARKLAGMQKAAAQVVAMLDAHPKAFKAMGPRLRFIGEDNISNVSAVKNLASMGKKRVYTFHEGPSGLETVLPGVKTHVLGPPTLQQSGAIRKQRSRDEDEFWHLQFKRLAIDGGRPGFGEPVFPNAVVAKGTKLPAPARWLAYRMQQALEDELMGIVTALDNQMNNTSLILLFETSKKKLLFPGDAQIENWSVALSKEKYRKLLANVDLYKVGHHGSLNATPRSMWGAFKKKSKSKGPDRLKTVLSTMPGKHGSEKSHTEVPRESLLTELRQQSELHSTHTLDPNVLFTRVDIAL